MISAEVAYKDDDDGRSGPAFKVLRFPLSLHRRLFNHLRSTLPGLDIETKNLVMHLATFFLAGGVISAATCFSLPPLPGSYAVGTVAFELIDSSRLDPLAPDTRSRDLMLSAFYPTQTTQNYTFANAYTLLYAGYLEETYGLPHGSAHTILSHASTSAPLASFSSTQDFPLLLFSPGYSLSRTMYTSLLSSLASHGFIILALDHPFDNAFLDYPDGRIVSNTQDSSVNWTSPDYVALRAADAAFVLDQMLNNASAASNVPGVADVLRPMHVAMFGHSFGGATSAATMLNIPSIQCGVDLDGILFGPVVNAGLDRPFAIMGEEFRNATVEPSWKTFRDASTGWKREVSVLGSLHYGLSDLGYEAQAWRDEAGDDVSEQLGELVEWVGPIEGERLLALMDTYLVDFWKGCFGSGWFGVWEGKSEDWPEVVFYEEA